MKSAIRTLSGYASLFGVRDLSGDVVHAGAFKRSLAQSSRVAMLLEHDAKLEAGIWTRCIEDARGLYVEGQILPDYPAAGMAKRLLGAGVDGLSIGFNLVRGRARPGGGRDLFEIALVEISIVRMPMLLQARLHRASAGQSLT